MSNVEDYGSPTEDASERKLETFSYLPTMDAGRIRKQVEYIVSRGWNPAIEHVEPARTMDDYWHMWKLPMFGEKDIDAILGEARACHQANPHHHVRLIAYDNLRQTLGACMVIHRGKGS